jgi:hypothetical protein
MRTCIEIEANFKAILNENKFTIPSRRSVKIDDFRKVDASHHLSSFEVMLPIWHGAPPTLKPFEAWLPFRGRPHQNGISLSWYKAYNASKHDRHEEFKQANLENLIMAVAALLVVLSAQFHTVDFNSGPQSISFMGYDYHPMEASIGSLFRIKFPDDWADNEKYEFDWAALKNQPDRFEKFDFDAIP